jgi:integrase
MAHLIKRPDSELWWGSFTGADGRRIRRSTGTSDKAAANAILVGWEKAAREGRKKVLTESRVRRTMNDILEQFTGAALSCPSVAEYFQGWIESKKEEKAQKTVLKYIQTANHFLSALGAKTQLPMEAIGAADIRIWREALLKEGRSGTTVNDSVKVISSVFEQARRLGRIPLNPCHELGAVRDEGKGERDTFTSDQLKALLRAASGSDWEGAVLAGFYTGLRLRDVAELTWEAVDSVDPNRWFLRVIASKNRKGVAVPLHPEFRGWLEQRPQGVGKAALFPSLVGRYTGGKSGLSGQFKKLMQNAGVIGRILRKGEGAGRTTSSLSFHSLRHSFTSAMTAAGVPEEVRMLLTGHSTRTAHRVYTHHEERQVWEAVSTLPKGLL